MLELHAFYDVNENFRAGLMTSYEDYYGESYTFVAAEAIFTTRNMTFEARAGRYFSKYEVSDMAALDVTYSINEKVDLLAVTQGWFYDDGGHYSNIAVGAAYNVVEDIELYALVGLNESYAPLDWGMDKLDSVLIGARINFGGGSNDRIFHYRPLF